MKILCLDDEQLALQMLEMCVKQVKPDADVLAFDDQDDLLDEAEQNGCDVAFLDIHMRGMNDVEVAKRLKQSNPKMNIIFVTGFSEYKADAMDMRASGYIMKPVTTEEIAAALFEDEPYDKKQQSYLQTLISAMMKTLKKNGAAKAVNKSYNALSVNPAVLDCDYYRFAELDAGAVNAYANEYMSQYY